MCCGSSSYSAIPWLSKDLAMSRRVRWIAGFTMCDGFSCSSWIMSSPRSVSTASMPRSPRNSFSPISSVVMLFILRTFFAPLASSIPSMVSRASAASDANRTFAPFFSRLSAARSTSPESGSDFMALASSRRRITLPSSG